MRIYWLAETKQKNMASKENDMMVASKLTTQISHLDTISMNRYAEKLLVDGFMIPDPYGTCLKYENSTQKWPNVLFGDIYNYLINTPGIYTQESMKAYKSLDGYNFFACGHVQEVLFSEVSGDSPVCVLKSKVMPSQSVTKKPHEPWVCVHKEKGYIISAHCTCKAGLGEACSHVAALLFKIERASLYGLNKESRTSVTCAWNQFYQKKVTPQPIDEIDFNRPKRKVVKKRKKPTADSDEDDLDVSSMFRKLRQIHPSACVLLKDDSETETASEDEDLPPLLHAFHDVDSNLPKSEFDTRCQNFMRDFQITPQQAKNLERMTCGQHESAMWRHQRKGRITATTAHDIMTLQEKTPRANVLKKVMKCCEKDLSNVAAVKFGQQFEKYAKLAYEEKMKCSHKDFVTRECGLFVDSTFPLFAATPDGIRKCDCHGNGIVEIKCSYKHRDCVIQEIKDDKFFLDENQKLKTSHRYYTQIQFQMYVCSISYCDFVVYTHKGIVVQTIPYDPEFVNKLIAKCTEFALADLIPEIIRHKLRN